MNDCLSPNIVRLVLLAAALAGVPHADHVSPPLALFFVIMLSWRSVGLWKPAWLPRQGILSLMMLLAITLLYSQYRGEWGRGTGTGIFVVALGLKLLELNRPRDLYLASYLILIVVAAQFLYLQSIAVTIGGLAVFLLVIAAWISTNRPNSNFRKAMHIAIKLLLQALPLAALLFLVFPRFHAPSWLMLQGDRHQANTGLSDTLEPGSINQLLMSPKLVFRVKFAGEPPPNSQLYWRGPVFSFIDGDTWRVSNADYVSQFQDDIRFEGKRYDYTLLLEPQQRNWVYALDLPANHDFSLQRSAGYQLLSHVKPGEAAEFSLSAYPVYNTGYITKTEYRENRQLPDEPSPRLRELVDQLHGFDDKPEVFIEQVLKYFRESGFRYTMQPPLLKDNPIERFLLESKQGYCEHYATAFVYLMRIADVPARVVTGYQGGQFNAVGRFFEVRQANAHAWAEVWLDGKGWVRVDPTTAILPSRVEQPVNVSDQIATGNVSLLGNQATAEINASTPRTIELIWDSADYQWQRWIVRYGSEQQLAMLNFSGLKKIGAIAFWAIYAVAAVLALMALWVLRHRCLPVDPEVVLYRRFCEKMLKAGFAIHIGEGPLAFAERTKPQLPEYAGLIDEITDVFIRLRYQPTATGRDMRLMKSKINKLRF